jgi:hypothetical protein
LSTRFIRGLRMLSMCLFVIRQNRETIAVNRGIIIRVFETLQDATEWLNKER